MDDYPVIVNNLDIRSFSNFLDNNFPGRPLRELSYLVDYYFFGLNPSGYHFQNIFWHALNCWLVYCLAIRLNLSRTVAWVSSLLFLVHPVHVEVVANSSHRKDSLALAFMLMALLAYMRIFEQKSTFGRVLWGFSVCALWVTAFFAKGNSLVFPALVVAYEYALVPAENRILVRWKQIVPFLCVSSFFALIAWYFYIASLPSFKMATISAFVKTENYVSFSFYAYVLMVLKSIAFMVGKLVVPLDLSMEYIYSVPKSLLDVWVLTALILIPACTVIAYRWAKNAPQRFFLLAFAAILWFPTANIVWHFSYFAADRYMYAPSAGICILVVMLSEQLLPTVRRYVLLGWIFILCLCAVLTYKQTNIWRNEINLYTQMLKVSPRALEAMVGLTNVYYIAKDYEKAAYYAQLAIERDFTDFRPYISLASIYDEQGKTIQAIELLKEVLKLRPDYFQAYTNLGVAYDRANNLLEAELALNKAVALNKKHAPAWYNLGVVLYKKNDKQGAKRAFTETVKCDPSYVDALTNLEIVCKETGDEACYNDAVSRKARLVVPEAPDKLQQR